MVSLFILGYACRSAVDGFEQFVAVVGESEGFDSLVVVLLIGTIVEGIE